MTLQTAGSTVVSNVTGLMAGKNQLERGSCLIPFHHAFEFGREANSTLACFACSVRKRAHVNITSAGLCESLARKAVLLSWLSAASNRTLSCFWLPELAAASLTAILQQWYRRVCQWCTGMRFAMNDDSRSTVVHQRDTAGEEVAQCLLLSRLHSKKCFACLSVACSSSAVGFFQCRVLMLPCL